LALDAVRSRGNGHGGPQEWVSNRRGGGRRDGSL